MTMVVNEILKKMVTELQTYMNVGLTEDNLLYVDEIKRGLIQENRNRKNIIIAVQGGDHEDPNYVDGIVSLEEFDKIAFTLPAREIGGGEMWWRRGVIKVEAFFIRQKLSEDEAHDTGYELLGKILNTLKDVNMTGVSDSYGEAAIKLFVYANTYFQSGGKPNQFIFRGKLLWACLTERP